MWHGVLLAVAPEVAAAGVPTVVMEVWAAAAARMVAQVVMVVAATAGGVTAAEEKAAECLARVMAVAMAGVETEAVRVVVRVVPWAGAAMVVVLKVVLTAVARAVAAVVVHPTAVLAARASAWVVYKEVEQSSNSLTASAAAAVGVALMVVMDGSGAETARGAMGSAAVAAVAL
jgi:hypothetical protein